MLIAFPPLARRRSPNSITCLYVEGFVSRAIIAEPSSLAHLTEGLASV
jgi:hypothetical protein